MVPLVEIAMIFVLFGEAGFPVVGVDGTAGAPIEFSIAGSPLADAQVLVAEDAAQLAEMLRPGRVLVWRHGSAYPAEAWPAIEAFLANGGRLLHLGGPVFEHPVTGPAGARHVDARRVSVPKRLGLNPGGWTDVSGAEHRVSFPTVGEGFDELGTGVLIATLPVGTRAFHLEPRFSSRKLRKDEEGSPGIREAVLHPITKVQRSGEDPRFHTATGVLVIDRLRERFAGGRWVLRLLSSRPDAREQSELAQIASRPPLSLTVHPTPATVHGDELAQVRIRVERPGEEDPPAIGARLRVRPPGGSWATPETIEIPAGRDVSIRPKIEPTAGPGLYLVRVSLEDRAPGSTATSGFWVFDEELFTGGEPLRVDGDLVLRGDTPEVGIGTTVMSRSAHREFLERPNPAEWDHTFRELASLGVRCVRTGIWSGWGDIIPTEREPNEEWLRALEAYVLCARRHDIAVIFTFFAFTPPPLEGSSPYFERPELGRQQRWLFQVSERFARVKTIIWDLINEPSFADPEKLWLCRPTDARAERVEFLRWLEATFEPEGPRTWQDEVRDRWRLPPDAPILPPTDDDFVDRIVFEQHHPYRARDYIRFAGDYFAFWASFHRRAIEQGGSTGLITVGQDEGGVNDRPPPQLHQDAVDFISMHTWWYDDAQLWDVAMARVPGKPCWVTETLLMRREELSGEIFRTAEQRRAIFARKLALPFAAGASHVITWAYDVNPYMDSDNEVSIGLRRVDGSYTPEHTVFRDVAGAFAERRSTIAPPADPTVTILLPTHDHRSPRDIVRGGMQRLVNLLVSLGHRVRVVYEERATTDLVGGEVVVMPSARGWLGSAWERVTGSESAGGASRIIVSGWFERDDVGRPAPRLGMARRGLAPTETVGERTLAFPLEATQSVFAAVPSSRTPPGSWGEEWFELGWRQLEPRLWHHPLPIDLARDDSVVRDLYRSVLGDPDADAPEPTPPGMFVTRLPRTEGAAWVVVNQGGGSRRVVRDPDGDGPEPALAFVAEGESAAIVWQDADGHVTVSGVGVRVTIP